MSALPASQTLEQERQQHIMALREYRELLDSTSAELDKPTLDLAAEVVALYENRSLDGTPFERRWQDELPGVELGRNGRPKNPDSFSRFSKWARDQTGLKGTALEQLRRADRLARLIHAGVNKSAQPTGERHLRPLWYLVREDQEPEVAAVWRDAVQLAGGEVPSGPDVKRALSDWRRRNESKGTGEKLPKGIRQKVKKEEKALRRLLEEAPSVAAPMLRQVLESYEAKPNPLAGVS